LKVVKAVGSNDETYSEIDLGIDGLPNKLKNDIIEQAGDLLKEEILQALAVAKSPVSGESFPALSKKYREFKISEGGSGSPDLELYGDLKDALTYEATDSGLKIGFFGDQAAKADGHNKFSGRENFTPKRRFLPDEGQSFKRDIVRAVKSIVEAGSGSVFKESDFSSVESSQDLYDVLREVYSGYSKAEIKEIVASNSDLLDILISNDLLRFL